MKYKVILSFAAGVNPGNVDASSSVSFYTSSQAIACAEGWANLSEENWAYLWNGSTWSLYKQ